MYFFLLSLFSFTSLFGQMVVIDKENFDTLFETETLLVVGIFKSGCGSCLHAKKLLDEYIPKYEDRITFGAIDYSSQKELAKRLEVRGFPTLLFFKNQELKGYHSGPLTRLELKELIYSLIPSG